MKPRLLGVHTLNAAPKTKDAGRVAGFLFSQAVVGAAQGAPERDAPERFPRDFKGRKRGRERWSILLIGKEGGGEKKRFPGKRAGRSGRRKTKRGCPAEIDRMDMEGRVFEAVVASPHRRNAARRWMLAI